MECSICGGEIIPKRDPSTGEIIWDQGHNASPINDGRCCDTCNATIVIPARLGRVRMVRKKVKANGRSSLTKNEKNILDGRISDSQNK